MTSPRSTAANRRLVRKELVEEDTNVATDITGLTSKESHAFRRCFSCKVLWCKEHSGFKLLTYDEVEEFSRGNPFIVHGYRPQLPVDLCLKSLFSWNNETVNIWSHLLGFAFFFACLCYDNVYTLRSWGAKWDDHLICSIFICSAQFCMLFSACYHLFFCMSERAHRFWFTLDMLGVSTGLMGIYLSGIYYSFYCFHWLHNVYLAIFCVLACTTIAAPCHPNYAKPSFNRFRLILYVLISMYGVIPSVHWVLIHGLYSDFTWRFLPNVLIVYAISVAAFLFYLLMIPERWLPGKVCHLGNSHQLGHVLVFLALAWWRLAGLDILRYRLSNAC